MLEFDESEDIFYITNRGAVFTSGRWKLPEGMWNPNDIKGQTVLLCGVEVKVIGVEYFAIPISPSNPYSLSFGLMVSFEDGEKIRA